MNSAPARDWNWEELAGTPEVRERLERRRRPSSSTDYWATSSEPGYLYFGELSDLVLLAGAATRRTRADMEGWVPQWALRRLVKSYGLKDSSFDDAVARARHDRLLGERPSPELYASGRDLRITYSGYLRAVEAVDHAISVGSALCVIGGFGTRMLGDLSRLEAMEGPRRMSGMPWDVNYDDGSWEAWVLHEPTQWRLSSPQPTGFVSIKRVADVLLLLGAAAVRFRPDETRRWLPSNCAVGWLGEHGVGRGAISMTKLRLLSEGYLEKASRLRTSYGDQLAISDTGLELLKEAVPHTWRSGLGLLAIGKTFHHAIMGAPPKPRPDR